MSRQVVADQLLAEAVQEESFVRNEEWIQDGNFWTTKCYFENEEGQIGAWPFVVIFEPNSDKVLKSEIGEY